MRVRIERKWKLLGRVPTGLVARPLVNRVSMGMGNRERGTVGKVLLEFRLTLQRIFSGTRR
jgi:hypothetical protein